jgi:hypothetical protein
MMTMICLVDRSPERARERERERERANVYYLVLSVNQFLFQFFDFVGRTWPYFVQIPERFLWIVSVCDRSTCA